MAATLFRTEGKIHPIEAHRPTLSKQELESVLDCLINDQLGPGKVVQRFEKSFSSTFQFKHVLAVNSLAAAYHLAYLALDIGPGSLILMSSLAPIQAYDAAIYTGAEVRLLDAARESFHPEPDAPLALCEERETAAFILDHTFGSYADFDCEALRKKGVKIIEDFTGVVGSMTESGVYAGTRGDISVCGLSQYDLITTGNGAILTSPSSTLARKAADSIYGEKRPPGRTAAYDYRLSDFQAAMGVDQLTRLGAVSERRKKIGRRYLENLRPLPHETFFRNPEMDGYLKFPVLINRPFNESLRYFNSLRIGAERALPQPLHHLLDLPRLEYPNAERIYQKAVSIPVYPSLTANNVERVCSSLRGLL